MPVTVAHTIRPADPEWRLHPDGVRHAILVRGALRYACGEGVLDQRWSGLPLPSWCPACLEVAGVTVPGPR